MAGEKIRVSSNPHIIHISVKLKNPLFFKYFLIKITTEDLEHPILANSKKGSVCFHLKWF